MDGRMGGWVVGARNGMDRLRFCFFALFFSPLPGPVLALSMYVCVCISGLCECECVGIFYRFALMRDGRTDGRVGLLGLAGGGLWQL